MSKPYELPDGSLQLPGGFVLMERSRDHVLAFNPESTMGRYATWTIGRDGGMCSGNYFCNPKSAAIDYEIRSGERFR